MGPFINAFKGANISETSLDLSDLCELGSAKHSLNKVSVGASLILVFSSEGSLPNVNDCSETSLAVSYVDGYDPASEERDPVTSTCPTNDLLLFVSFFREELRGGDPILMGELLSLGLPKPDPPLKIIFNASWLYVYKWV